MGDRFNVRRTSTSLIQVRRWRTSKHGSCAAAMILLFSVAACGGGGGGEDSGSAQPSAPAPTLAFSASQSLVAQGNSVSLEWTSTNSSSCTASGDWSGSKSTSGNETISSLAQTSSFTLQCSGNGGSISRSIQVEVIPLPTVDLLADSGEVLFGEPIQLSWQSENATSCELVVPPAGSVPTSGSIELTVSGPGTYSFEITCSGDGGSANDTTVVIVLPPPEPVVSLNASSQSLAYQEFVELTWSASNADQCEASGSWSGARGVSGSESIGPLTEDSRFVLTCSGQGGSNSESVDISVTPPSVPVIQFSAIPDRGLPGLTTILSWSATTADSCEASSGWSGTKSTDGTEEIGPLQSSEDFEISCTGPGGSSAASVSVMIGPAPTLYMRPSQAFLTKGTSGHIEYLVTGATSCQASGAWSGERPATSTGFTCWADGRCGNGFEESFDPIAETSEFILSCSNEFGETAASTTVTVDAYCTGSDFQFSGSSRVSAGERAYLFGENTGFSSCLASGDWSGNQPSRFGVNTQPLLTSSQYTLSCDSPKGRANKIFSVGVDERPRPTIELKSNWSKFDSTETAIVVAPGGLNIDWDVQFVDDLSTCSRTGGWSGPIGSSTGSSSIDLSSPDTNVPFEFEMSCSNESGVSTVSIQVDWGRQQRSTDHT